MAPGARGVRSDGPGTHYLLQKLAGLSHKNQSESDDLNQVVAKHGHWGFRLCFDWMRDQGRILESQTVLEDL